MIAAEELGSSAPPRQDNAQPCSARSRPPEGTRQIARQILLDVGLG